MKTYYEDSVSIYCKLPPIMMNYDNHCVFFQQPTQLFSLELYLFLRYVNFFI